LGEFEYLAIDHLFVLTMKESRAARRKPLMMTGVIILSERAPRIQCKVIDLSEIGASLQVPARIDIPEKFDLVVEGIPRRCRLVRRSGNKIGAAFEQTERHQKADTFVLSVMSALNHKRTFRTAITISAFPPIPDTIETKLSLIL
jgi:hypothetical protein